MAVNHTYNLAESIGVLALSVTQSLEARNWLQKSLLIFAEKACFC